jgi:hypothetical protein
MLRRKLGSSIVNESSRGLAEEHHDLQERCQLGIIGPLKTEPDCRDLSIKALLAPPLADAVSI